MTQANINTKTKELYAEILKIEGLVSFWHQGLFYSISEHSDGGFMTDVYTNDDGGFFSDDEQNLTFVDGGHCTSESEIEGIEFMMND